MINTWERLYKVYQTVWSSKIELNLNIRGPFYEDPNGSKDEHIPTHPPNDRHLPI